MPHSPSLAILLGQAPSTPPLLTWVTSYNVILTGLPASTLVPPDLFSIVQPEGNFEKCKHDPASSLLNILEFAHSFVQNL